VSGGPAPQLGTCDGCHQLGLAAARESQREAAQWSVRRAFDHRKHGGECTSCHTDLHASGLLELATPAKATCVPCHDGKAAFKLTGTTCKKCHA
jgi:predicted CXXCH cytochrome family protein